MIIGLCGASGAGKDSVAQVLKSQGYSRVAFADPIKNFLYQIDFAVNSNNSIQTLVDAVGWDKAKTDHPEIRRLMQATGETIKSLDQDVWIKAAAQAINVAEGPNIVVTDVRFAAEVKFLMDINAVIIEVTRPFNPLDIGKNHVSEQLSISTPYRIENTGSLEELENVVSLALKGWNFSKGYTKKYLVSGKGCCIACELWKDVEEFPKDAKTTWGISYCCRACTNDRAKSKKSRAPARRAQEYISIDPTKIFKNGRLKLVKKYGLTEDSYQDMMIKQGGACAICLMPETRVHHKSGKVFQLTVDHCHQNGRVRGLLCSKCNRAFGALGDTKEQIKRVVRYLS